MEIEFTEQADKDFIFWEITDKKIWDKIVTLLQAISENPFKGIGKPEPLRYNFKGYWSRRITEEHRLVYKVSKNVITIISCRFHYR
jgi:toxin YoeB